MYIDETASDDWSEFTNCWWEVGIHAYADLSSGGQWASREEFLEKAFPSIAPEDPEIPPRILSGEIARAHVFGRTDLGDYRNRIKNVNNVPSGVTVHVKPMMKQNRIKNVLTIEDFSGECDVINIVTTSADKIVVNVGKLPSDTNGSIQMQKVELE